MSLAKRSTSRPNLDHTRNSTRSWGSFFWNLGGRIQTAEVDQDHPPIDISTLGDLSRIVSSSTVGEDRLCPSCSQINFHTLFYETKKVIQQNDKIFESDLLQLSRESWDRDGCRLCQFWTTVYNIRVSHPDLLMVLYLRIRGKKISEEWHMCTGRLYPNTVSVPPNINEMRWRYIGHISQENSSPEEKSLQNLSRVDMVRVKQWITACLASSENVQKERTAIPGLRFIDCKTREVVDGSKDAKYLTLSYVWGVGAVAPQFKLSLDMPLPNTIEDAIYFTKEIGFQYLWVDQCCINQQDPKDIQDQCQQMDRIYSESELTLVAAAGANPSYGLPGVRSRSRLSRKIFTENVRGEFRIDGRDLVQASVWCQRGWTYQEMFLSRRLLYFVDTSLIFQNDGEVFAEGWTEKLTRPPNGFINVVSIKKGEPRVIYQCIKTYSERELTYSDDALRAIQGMFGYFSQLEVYHHWGIPLFTSLVPDPDRNRGNTTENSSLASLDMTAALNTVFSRGLTWKCPSRIQSLLRRSNFPSWSWLGWSCPVEWPLDDLRRRWVSSNVQVEAETRNGVLISLEQLYSQCKIPLGQEDMSRFIRVTSWVTELEDIKFVHSRWTARAGAAENLEFFSLNFRGPEALDVSVPWIALWIGHVVVWDELFGGFLICCKVGDYYERVDLAHLPLHRDRFDSQHGVLSGDGYSTKRSKPYQLSRETIRLG